MASIPSWVWLAAGSALIALGAWFIITGRLRRRKHGGRRCPICTYDMNGLGTLTCPECGQTAANEQALSHRRPMRLRWTLGATLLAMGWVGTETPALIAHGWVGAVPEWALGLWGPVTPAADPSWTMSSRRFTSWLVTAGNQTISPELAWNDRFRRELVTETWRRMSQGEMNSWAGGVFARRAVLSDDSAFSLRMNIPLRWPWDMPFPSPSNASTLYYTARPLTGPATSVAVEGSLQAGGYDYPFGEIQVPVDASKGRANFLDLDTNEQSSAAVAAAIRPRLVIQRGHVFIAFDERNHSEHWGAVKSFVHGRVDVLVEGRAIGQGRFGIRWGYTEGGVTTAFLMAWTNKGEESVLEHPERVELLLTGDPAASTVEFIRGERTESNHAWAGSIRVKPTVVQSPQAPAD